MTARRNRPRGAIVPYPREPWFRCCTFQDAVGGAEREMNHHNICDLEMIISQEEKTVRAATRELLVRNRESVVRNIFAGRAWRLAWFAQCGGLDPQAEAAVDHSSAPAPLLYCVDETTIVQALMIDGADLSHSDAAGWVWTEFLSVLDEWDLENPTAAACLTDN